MTEELLSEWFNRLIIRIGEVTASHPTTIVSVRKRESTNFAKFGTVHLPVIIINRQRHHCLRSFSSNSDTLPCIEQLLRKI